MQFLRVCFQNAASTTEVSRRNYQLLPATRSGYVAEANAKTKNEFVFRFSYFNSENETRIRFSFFLLQF